MRVYSRSELAEQARLLAADHFCQNPALIAEKLLDKLKPRETVGTIEWSKTRRVVRKPDGTKTGWSMKRSRALLPIADAHDNPAVREIIVPKPSRIGGTMIAENFAAKCLDNGPSWDVGWYLAGPTEVTSYADRILKPIMEDHFGGQLPKAGTDGNTKTLKRIGSQVFELMVMSSKTTTNRQFAYMVFDEPDSYTKAFRSNFLEQGRQRQGGLGTDRKIYACAHPDVGWTGGIAAAWILSTQGIFVFRCPCCGAHGSPYPTKYWPEVPRFRLSYEKAAEGTPIDRRLSLARRTAVIACPNGCPLGEAEREQMIDEGGYMHKGQILDIDAGIIGEMEDNETWGFWVHVLMSTQVPLSNLAAQLEGAVEHKERTGKSDKLKQVLVRTFGEVPEGVGELNGVDAKSLRSRAGEDEGFPRGFCPPDVRFITAAVDVGKKKFDISFRGWDLDGRSWWLERTTLHETFDHLGHRREIATRDRIEDWNILIDEVVERKFPIIGRADLAMPVALTMIDVSDGHVSWIGREFASRCFRRGLHYGLGDDAFPRVQLLQGNPSAKAPELHKEPKFEDQKGRKFPKGAREWSPGVFKLKELILERLGIEDDGPGYCRFATGISASAYEEYFNEPLIDGEFVRNGPNESLDLFVYEEVGRLILRPDRKDIRWSEGKLPPWAKPVSLKPKGGDHADGGQEAAKQPRSMVERHRSLNRKPRNDG